MSPEPQHPEPEGATPGAGDREAQTLRPGSSIAVGVIAGLCGLALLVPALLTPPRSWSLVSVVLLVLVLVWLFVVHPCVVVHAEGLRLVNPLRTVELTWPAITEVRSRWSLELVADGTRYTAWGVPADPGRPRYGRGMLNLGANQVRGRGSTELPTRSKVQAQLVAAEVEQLIAADRKRKDGRTPRIATQAWDPVSVGLLLAATVFFVIATFVA
ncbi:MAG: PH domain-containing protein [Dermatophilaceae bacterium]|nr:PH domain-containing protein [Dermatophilaceae bacterium]